ncbi:MAG: HypC/HybG/HupF family hydrogenase formation chaperone [Pseudomonadota bacterium]
MCLGIPMEIVSIDGHNARCNAQGVEMEVNLFMLLEDEIAVGDFVMVHVGYAIEKMSAAEAHSRWELFDQLTQVPDTDA